ncbi:MAG: GGDEF domain-containing protein [Pseudomonadota bacterium]
MVTLTLALPALAYRIHTLETARKNEISAQADELMQTAERAAISQQELLASVESFLRTAAFIHLQTSKRGAGCSLVQSGAPLLPNWITNLAIAGPDGIIQCATLPSLVGLDANTRDFYRLAIATSKMTVSDFVLSRGKNEPALLVAFPVQSVDADTKSAIIVSVGAQWFGRVLDQHKVTPGVTVYLIDGKGTVLTSKPLRSDAIGNVLAAPQILPTILRSDRGSNLDDSNHLYSFAHIDNTDLRLVVGIDEQTMLSKIDSDLSLARREFFGGGLLVLLATWFLSELLILRPIRRITSAARKRADGHREAALDPAQFPPEFSLLASAVNGMAEKFEGREDSLVFANTELNLLSSRDALTGLMNRRAMDVSLDLAWKETLHKKAPIAFVMIDIDRFKQFNDSYGHTAGDDCLRRIGAVLNKIADFHSAIAARYGGEEFVIIFPSISAIDALGLAEFVRLAIQGLNIPHKENVGGLVTASLGLKMSNATGVSSIAKLVSGADENLYVAKRLGRNQTVNDARWTSRFLVDQKIA